MGNTAYPTPEIGKHVRFNIWFHFFKMGSHTTLFSAFMTGYLCYEMTNTYGIKLISKVNSVIN
jgi:hypothetical protein